jgi:hypothetical protein
MIEIDIGEKRTTLRGDDLEDSRARLVEMEGPRSWHRNYHDIREFTFETTPHNLRIIRNAFPELALGLPQPDQQPASREGIVPAFRMVPRDYQLDCLERFRDAPVFALFSDPGTGKTKTMLDIISWRWHAGLVTGVLVFSSPKGVHAQWVEEQIPLHMWENVPSRAAFWNGRKPPEWLGHQTTAELQIFSSNIDALNSDKAYAVLEKFCHVHKGRLMIVVDESDSIKTWGAKRSKRLRQLAFNAQCKQRAIMTGTPIAKDLTDEWSQFYFLNPDIIGHKYKTSFLAQFCIMGGFENRNVVGHRNLDLFKQLTAPFIFRATKEQLHLPDKIHDTVVFDLTAEQLRLIRELKDTFIAVVDSTKDQRVLASHAATAILRMQQIACGFARVEDLRNGYDAIAPEGTIIRLSNPRMDALLELIGQLDGRKVIVWCRFQHDVEQVHLHLDRIAPARKFFGPMGDAERSISKNRFINDPATRFLVATPDSAGRGMDGLQKGCSHAIYYSNSFNAIARWQSEDRIHRIGQRETASYFDLIARGSPDRAILKNLRAKKDLSALVLDDLRRIIEGEDQ